MSTRTTALALAAGLIMASCELVVVDFDAHGIPSDDWTILADSEGQLVGAGGLELLPDGPEGHSALVVTAPGAPAGGSDAGAIALHSNTSHEPEVGFGDGLAMVLGQDGDRLGEAVLLLSEQSEGDWLAVGSPGADDEGVSNGGAVRLLRPELLEGEHQVEGLASASILGSTEEGDLGSGMATADLDGDGVGDLLLGAPGADAGEGEVYIFLGGAFHLGLSSHDADWSLDGTSGDDHLGRGLHAGPDVDNDGISDFMICSGTINRSYVEDVGACRVVIGGDDLWDGWGSSWWTSGIAVIYGNDTGDLAGEGAQGAVLADLDGDDRPDLAIGATRAEGMEGESGKLAVFTNAQLDGSLELSEAALTVAGSGSFGSSLAQTSVPGALVVGAPDSGSAEEGALFLLHLDLDQGGALDLSSAGATQLLVGEPGDRLGTRSTLVADLDEDGSIDLIAAAPDADAGAPGGGKVNIRSSGVQP